MILEEELNLIKNENIKKFVEEALKIVPEYFWEVPASSTGRYHPSYALGDGGLSRHVKASVRIAVELFNMTPSLYTETEKDIIISTLLLHDCAKSGIPKQKYTRHEHPIIIADFILQNNDICNLIDTETLNIILSALKSHMGRWTTARNSKVILPEPKSKVERFVHMCDYLASRKCLEFNFDIPISRG